MKIIFHSYIALEKLGRNGVQMKIFLIIIIAICVTGIFDARKIGERFFSSDNINKLTKQIKIISFIILVISAIILCLI